MNYLIHYVIVLMAMISVPVLRNTVSLHLDTIQFFYIWHAVYSVLYLLMAVYFLNYKKSEIVNVVNGFKKLPLSVYIFIIITTLFILFSEFSLTILYSNFELSSFYPTLMGLSKLSIIAIGILIFKESLNFEKILGVILTVLGIYLLN